MKRLGLIVNPIAGMGGRVGLKGTDGAEILARAQALGAVPEAPNRASVALRQLLGLPGGLDLLAFGGDMGEDVARSAGFQPVVIGRAESAPSTGEDTRRAALAMADARVDLLLFAGGDGTARDIHQAVDRRVTVLGIPAGVKIHSAVYAVTPRAAGQLAAMFLDGRVAHLRDAEVMDIDEQEFRANRLSAALHGFLRIPFDEGRVQSMKAGRVQPEESALEQIAYRLVDEMLPGGIYIIGPGTSTRVLKQQLGIDGSLLGVDVVRDRRLIARDAGEHELLEILADDPAATTWIIVTIIGGQGYIFGRGNQQISPRVLNRVGRDHIRVIATRQKVAALGGRPLLVDTGDPAADALLSGYIRVVVGYNDELVMRVAASP